MPVIPQRTIDSKVMTAHLVDAEARCGPPGKIGATGMATERRRVPLAIGIMATFINKKFHRQIIACYETFCQSMDEIGIPFYFFCGTTKPAMPLPRDIANHIVHLPEVGDDYASASDKHWLGYAYMHKHLSADWYGIIGTDSYIYPLRLLRLLGKYRSNFPAVVGGYGEMRAIRQMNVYFNFGGGGTYLSEPALALLLPHIPSIRAEWRATALPNACDVALGYYCHRYDIPIITERTIYSCSWTGKFNDPPTDSFSVCGPIIIDKMAACHYMSPRSMRAIHRWKDDINFYNSVFLRERYLSKKESQISPYLLKLFHLARRCRTVCEVQTYTTLSSWSIVRGLMEGGGTHYATVSPSADKDGEIIKSVCIRANIRYSKATTIEPSDLIFVDAWSKQDISDLMHECALKASRFIAVLTVNKHIQPDGWALKESVNDEWFLLEKAPPQLS